MADFFSLVGTRYTEFPQIKLNRTTEVLIQELVLKKLRLRDLNALRDKYEGQAYLNNQTERICSKLAAMSFFNIPKKEISINWLRSGPLIIEYQNVSYSIVTTKFGNLPKLDYFSPDHDSLLLYVKDKLVFSCIGILRKEDIIRIKEANNREQLFVDFTLAKQIDRND